MPFPSPVNGVFAPPVEDYAGLSAAGVNALRRASGSELDRIGEAFGLSRRQEIPSGSIYGVAPAETDFQFRGRLLSYVRGFEEPSTVLTRMCQDLEYSNRGQRPPGAADRQLILEVQAWVKERWG